jgi:hypothetical protein
MAMRNGLLGLAGTVAVAGGLRAEPPAHPLVEGREPNPVVREFHEPEPPPFTYANGFVRSGRAEVEGVSVPRWWGLMMDHLTMPLGTVPAERWQ